MKKNLILLLILLLFINSCKTHKKNFVVVTKPQIKELNYIPYYLKVYEADSLFNEENYQGAYEILDSLFKTYEPVNTLNIGVYDKYIISSFKTKHFEDFKTKVTKAHLDFGGLAPYGSMNDSIYQIAGLSKEDVINLKKEYRSSLNDSLRVKISKMRKEDQEVRKNYNEEGMKFYAKKHEKELDEIFKKYGFPTDKLIGSMLYFDSDSNEEFPRPDVVLIHQGANKDAKEKILPILFNYLKEGKCSPLLYAWVYDKHEIIYNNKQYYNSWDKVQVARDTSLVNRKKNDSIRRTIGLQSLEYDISLEKKRNENIIIID